MSPPPFEAWLLPALCYLGHEGNLKETVPPVSTPNHGQGYKEKNPKFSAPHVISNEVSLMSDGGIIPVSGYLGHWGNLRGQAPKSWLLQIYPFLFS